MKRLVLILLLLPAFAFAQHQGRVTLSAKDSGQKNYISLLIEHTALMKNAIAVY